MTPNDCGARQSPAATTKYPRPDGTDRRPARRRAERADGRPAVSAEPIRFEDELQDAGPSAADLEDPARTADAYAYLTSLDDAAVDLVLLAEKTGVETEASRWTRTNLADYVGLPPEVPEIAGVFYPGQRHLISGPGEAAKTWLCLAAAVAEIKASRGVIWADLDGMGPRDITARLVALGVTKAEIADLVYFTNPEGELEPPEIAELLAWASANQCRLFVADAFTGFLVAHDLDGYISRDVEKAWLRLDPLREAGIAVVLIDHVVKNERAQNGQAIGSERKGTAAYLHFDLKPRDKLSRGGTGRSRVGTSRDRGAYFPRPSAGELVLYSDADTGAVTWKIDPPRQEGETFRPTGYMEKVSRYLEKHPDAAKGSVETGVGGKAEYVRSALDLLVDEGFVSRTPGAHGALIHNVEKPYREAEDVLVPSSSPGGTT